jgi:hypothetical protein
LIGDVSSRPDLFVRKSVHVDERHLECVDAKNRSASASPANSGYLGVELRMVSKRDDKASGLERWREAGSFLCNLGYGDPGSLHPRLPRLSFTEAGSIL